MSAVMRAAVVAAAAWAASSASALEWLAATGAASVVHVFPANATYRYFSVVQFRARGGAWPDDAWVVAKDAIPAGYHGHEHDRLVAWPACERGLLAAGGPAACMADAPRPLTDWRKATDANWAHNAAFAMIGGTLHGVGGRDGRRAGRHKRRDGVYARSFASANALLAGPNGTAQRAVLYGNHSGCVERRPRFAPNCEFDGRFSLVVDRRGDVLLYARANVVGEAAALGTFGGRHVQVARAARVRGPWGPFALLEFPNFRPFDRDHNAYFGAVARNPGDPASLVGLFPVRGADFAAIAAAASCDGVAFGPLVAVYNATAADSEGRTNDHPADGWLVDRRRAVAFFFVHRDVPGIAPPGARAALLRVPVPLAALAALPGGCAAAADGGAARRPRRGRRRRRT